MSAVLPADLSEAEQRTFVALSEVLGTKRRGRWQVTWKFEGLRLLGPSIRLALALKDSGIGLLLAWPVADRGHCSRGRTMSWPGPGLSLT